MTRRISVRAIVLLDGKLLCARLKPYHDAIQGVAGGNDWWCLPGGGLDEGEALTDGIRREMLEETGIEPVVGNLLYVQQFFYADKDYLEFFFHVTNGEDYVDIDLSKTSHGATEIAEMTFIDPTAVTVMPTFLATEDIATHAASNGPARIFNMY